MATIINDGVLLQKPSRLTATPTHFETQLIDTYFVGQHHPIDYSPEFRKFVKKEYDKERTDVEIDLNSGCNEFDEKPGALSFDLLLDYLIDQRKLSDTNLKEIVHGASIVCRRGVLNKLINAPYSKSLGFMFAVKRFQSIYFIKEISPESYLRQNNARRPGDPYYYLPKFKNHIICPYGDKSYQPPKEVNTWEQMQGIYVCDLSLMNDTKVLKIYYGTEIDAFDQDDNVVEIKLQKGELSSDHPSPYMTDKLRKWYFQSQLVNADTIFVGFRKDNVVNSIKKIHLSDLPLLVKAENRWHHFCSYSSTMTILSTVCEFYENNVQANETLVIQLPPGKTDVLYHIQDDGIQNMLPNKFRDAFEETVTLVDETDKRAESGYTVGIGRGWFDDILSKVHKI